MSGEFFLRYSARSRLGYFGSRLLGVMLKEDGGTVSIDPKRPNILECRLPKWAIREDKKVPLATIIALMDDASTYSIALEDRRGRFGVSVQLSGVVSKNPPQLDHNTQIIFDTQCKKIGHTLAFADCFVSCKITGQLIAHCEHIKYLPSGFIMDNAYRLLEIPLFRDGLQAWISSQPEPKLPIEELSEIPHSEFEVSKDLCNPVGALHGGGSCVLAERCAAINLSQESVNAWPVAIKSTYLSSLKPGQFVTFKRQLLDTDLGDNRIGRSVSLVSSSSLLSAVDVSITYEYNSTTA